MPIRTVLVLGYGVLGGKVIDELVRTFPDLDVTVGGRDEQALVKRVNLARYSALNFGDTAEVTPMFVDVRDVMSTAAVIRRLQPDLIFNATAMVPWWKLDELPPRLSKEIKRAGSGIWAATDLLLPLRLAQALSAAAYRGVFVNGSFPDLVNRLIYQPSVGPVCGVGNVANAVPGVMLAVASMLNRSVREIRVRFVAHHFLSYSMPSTGTSAGAPFALQVMAGDEDVTSSIDSEALFGLVASRFLRVKGLAGQAVTMSSAMMVLNALIGDETRYAHAPGVHGRLGGYPVRIRKGAVEFDLPSGLSIDDAEAINVAAGIWDGIQLVSTEGQVFVTAEADSIARRLLQYDANGIDVHNCETRALELVEKYERMALR